jgi:hypothetical protein
MSQEVCRPEIRMDVFHDVVLSARMRLAAVGYSIAASERDEQVCGKYFNVVHRRIDVKRAPFYSPTISSAPPTANLVWMKSGENLAAGKI